MIAEASAQHLPKPPDVVHVANGDLDAMRAAFIRRFDEDLPRTETLMAVAHIGYRMALRDRGLKPSVETACGLDGEATKAPVREAQSPKASPLPPHTTHKKG